MNEMVFPWDIDQQALKYAWPVSLIKNRRMPTRVWEAPADRTLDQAVKLLRFLQGSRNWVVCFSMSPSYMRTLYTYVEALWVLNTGTPFEEVDIKDILMMFQQKSVEDEREEQVIETGLLVLPYTDAVNISVQRAGSMFLSSVLMKRKVQRRATITDIFVSKPVDKEMARKEMRKLSDVYGTSVVDLFSGEECQSSCVSM